MPTHVYQPLRNPPTWRDRLLAHPLDTTVAVVAVLFGVLVGVSLFLPNFIPSSSMDKMPPLIVLLVGGFLGLGGCLALIGINWWGDKVSFGWLLERVGWLLAAGGFLTYSLSVSWHYPGSVFSWAIPLSLGLGCLLRFWSVVRIERSVRRTLAKVKGGAL